MYHLHRQVALLVHISLTPSLSHHPSLSSIAPDRSSKLYLVSVKSCRYFTAGQLYWHDHVKEFIIKSCSY